MPREYTADEIREMFLDHVRHCISYWATLPEPKSIKDRLSGLTHSIFASLDGCTLQLPGFLIIPNSNEEDKQYYIDNDENYFPIPPDVELCDIGGGLHELLYSKEIP